MKVIIVMKFINIQNLLFGTFFLYLADPDCKFKSNIEWYNYVGYFLRGDLFYSSDEILQLNTEEIISLYKEKYMSFSDELKVERLRDLAGNLLYMFKHPPLLILKQFNIKLSEVWKSTLSLRRGG